MNTTGIFSRARPQRPQEAPDNQDFQFFFQNFSMPFFFKKTFIKGELRGKVLKPLGMALVGIQLDDMLEAFSLSALTIDVFWSPNHKTLFNFALLCLWNVQIQFQFWCWLS